LLLTLEWALVSAAFRPGLGGQWLGWFVVPFCSLVLVLGSSRVVALRPRISPSLQSTPLAWGFLLTHVAVFAVFLALCPFVRPGIPRDPALVVLFFALAFLSIPLALLAFVPARSLAILGQGLRGVWVYACAGGLVIGGLVYGLVFVWNHTVSNPLEVLTFRWVEACLGLLRTPVSLDTANMRIATDNFGVRIRGGCSGAEGLVLMLVFSMGWLWFFRREIRFPRALLLVPAALAAIWVANVGRITALILIGHAGAPGVARGGFHSQAGWILFNAIAVGFVVAAGRLSWLSRNPAPPTEDRTAQNPTAAYLVPFLAILAASLVSRAASAGFEWLYPLRFIAAVVALWLFRARYSSLDWRFGWLAAGVGCAVLALWLGMDAWLGGARDLGLEKGLAALPPVARFAWIVTRAVAAIVTVPMAEELAFRGYLPRRLMAADFESIRFRGMTPLPILASSVVFGLLHGSQWIAGTVAGVAYALVLRHRGRMGDAVVAHAATNALLAAWVVTRGDWHLW
jgi:exosortase E/protease (VPEID-CTERM system)